MSLKQLPDKPINRPASGGPMQKLDHRAYYKGEQISDNYNYRSCKRGQDCKFLHNYCSCQRNHTITNCPKLNDDNRLLAQEDVCATGSQFTVYSH